MADDVETQTEEVKRFYVQNESGERLEASHVIGSQEVYLSYLGFHGQAQITIPVSRLAVVRALIQAVEEELSE